MQLKYFEIGRPRPLLALVRALIVLLGDFDRDVDELELAMLYWVHWFNENRLHGHCNDAPPAEYEAAFYAVQRANPGRVGIQ